MHHTIGIRTVIQAKGVSEFMDGFLFHAFEEKSLIIRQAVEALAEAGQRDDGKMTAQFCFSEDEIEPMDIEVNISNTQDFFLWLWLYEGAKLIHKSRGKVLISLWIVCLLWKFHSLVNFDLA